MSIVHFMISFVNTDRRVAGLDGLKHTVACWPSTADDYEALAPFRAEAAIAMEGVRYYNALRQEWRTLQYVFAWLTADTIQVYDTCRCGSNGGFLGCPNCLVTRPDRLRRQDTEDHTLVPHEQLTNMIISQVVSLPGLTDAHRKGLLRKFGIGTLRPSPFAWVRPQHAEAEPS